MIDADFARAYASGRATVLRATLVADLETPVSAYLKLAAGRAVIELVLDAADGAGVSGANAKT